MIRKILHSVIKLGGFIVLILGLGIAAGCSKDDLQQETGVLESGIPDENAQGVQVLEYTHNRLDYIIEAERIERFTDRRMMYGYTVTLTSYDKDGMLSSVIKADTTIVDDARNIIFANGNAYYESPEGTIKTQRFVWERTTDHITVPTYVVLTRGEDVLRGYNLRTDSRLSFVDMETVSAEGYIVEEDISW